MTRKHEDSDAGREARRLFNGLWNRGVVLLAGNERGANEGLGQREILALSEENSRPYGLTPAPVIAHRARQAGHDGGIPARDDGQGHAGPGRPAGPSTRSQP